MSGERVHTVGPVGIRDFHLGACEENRGHAHEYDHTTMVVRGSIALFVDGAWSRPYKQGEDIFVPAGREHIVKALEPDTWYKCVFSHRDFGGIIVQSYEGNDAAYGHALEVQPIPQHATLRI